MESDIKHQWFFPHPPEKVWDYLTKPELVSQWLMETDIQPIVGHTFTFKTRARVKFGFDGTVYCKVLEVVPVKRFSYSWKGGNGQDKTVLDTVVTWVLIPKDNGTELSLTHSGFKGIKNLLPYIIMNKGWGKISKRLALYLNNYKK